MKSENLQHEKRHRKPIRIPSGCEVLRGDLRSGKHLQIRDFQGSIMCWIQKSEALEKLETQMKKHYAVLHTISRPKKCQFFLSNHLINQ